MILTYLEWMASLPWNKLAGGEIDIRRARQVLDEDHYDLEKVKDRILEYLAVKKLRQERAERAVAAEPGERRARRAAARHRRQSAREPILCFVGPPGVGKTSLGQSIARALGRRFVRMSLGGVRDEAEIRGPPADVHRRAAGPHHPGAAPRRDARPGLHARRDRQDRRGLAGDPSSALLEVLDPAQNHTFVDNYLGVAFDLSQVLFIATANTLDTIPGPLRDRMEMLPLSGLHRRGEDRDRDGSTWSRSSSPPTASPRRSCPSSPRRIRQIVRGYTREAGVRNLDREIATVARKVARRIAEGQREPVGSPPTTWWSTSGGRASSTRWPSGPTAPGCGDGPGLDAGGRRRPVRRGDDDAEHARSGSSSPACSATSCARAPRPPSPTCGPTPRRSASTPSSSRARPSTCTCPPGAIPKDGPSAGVTIVTALASLATRRPVRSDLAMTGEITLRGKVLPVGGIKEKVLAAHRAGIRS